MLDEDLLFTVTDLKQFAFCPRVVYYEYCLPHLRPRTFKMDAGRDMHELEQKRAIRRTLTQYDLAEGERYFDVALTAPALHLTGVIDEVVETPDGLWIPVDYKLARRVGHNHRIQLTAYAMLIEAATTQKLSHGFIYLIPLRKTSKIAIPQALRLQVDGLLRKLHQTISHELHPEATPDTRKCMGCEFRRFCNDV